MTPFEMIKGDTMSDQMGQPPPSGVPTPSTPPPPPPPPVPAEQPVYAAPAAVTTATPVQPPAKKSRKGLWIAIGIILVLLLCCGCGAGFLVYSSMQEQAAYEDAFTKLEAAAEEFEAIDVSSSSDDPAAFVEEARPAIADFRDAVRTARDDIRKIGDSDKKTAALKALASLDKALVKLDSALKGVSDLGQLKKDVEAMAADVKTADDATGEAIDHANNKRWNEADAQVAIALASYRAAEAKMAALEAAWPGVGMSEMTGIIKAKRAAAEDAEALVKLGRAGKYSAYNDTINAYNAHQKDIRAANQPAFIENPELLVGDLEKSLEEVGREADAALKALEDLQ